MVALHSSSLRLESARVVLLPLLPTPAGPEAIETFRGLARVEQKIQQGIQLSWNLERTRWNTLPGLGCSLHNAPFRSPYPSFDFQVVNPELSIFEIQLTSFLVRDPKPYRLEIRVAKLATEATLAKGEHHEWSARWTK